MKEIILYPGKIVKVKRGGRIRKAKILKTYSGYALCEIEKKRDFVFFTEILELIEDK